MSIMDGQGRLIQFDATSGSRALSVLAELDTVHITHLIIIDRQYVCMYVMLLEVIQRPHSWVVSVLFRKSLSCNYISKTRV